MVFCGVVLSLKNQSKRHLTVQWIQCDSELLMSLSRTRGEVFVFCLREVSLRRFAGANRTDFCRCQLHQNLGPQSRIFARRTACECGLLGNNKKIPSGLQSETICVFHTSDLCNLLIQLLWWKVTFQGGGSLFSTWLQSATGDNRKIVSCCSCSDNLNQWSGSRESGIFLPNDCHPWSPNLAELAKKALDVEGMKPLSV